MISCGNDIIRIKRIEETIEKLGETFLKRIYTEEEIQYCESRRMCKYQSYAARFAAKEAVYKAISPEESFEFEWKDIEVKRRNNGKPYISFNGNLKEFIKKQGFKEFDLSLTHEGEYAIATVVAIKE